jgi:GTP-binding protein LepA
MAALSYEPEFRPILGNGFRCGFLGLLHMDIVRERLEREFFLTLVVTVPGVKFIITKTNGTQLTILNPGDFPEPNEIMKMESPCLYIRNHPVAIIGPIMELMTEYEGVYVQT